jgi:hypothetical protein
MVQIATRIATNPVVRQAAMEVAVVVATEVLKRAPRVVKA